MKDDSPVFPTPGEMGTPPAPGLTKREWMAAHIVVGLLAYPGAFANASSSALNPQGNKDLSFIVGMAPSLLTPCWRR